MACIHNHTYIHNHLYILVCENQTQLLHLVTQIFGISAFLSWLLRNVGVMPLHLLASLDQHRVEPGLDGSASMGW